MNNNELVEDAINRVKSLESTECEIRYGLIEDVVTMGEVLEILNDLKEKIK